MPSLLKKYWLLSRPAHLQFGRDTTPHLGNCRQSCRTTSTQITWHKSKPHFQELSCSGGFPDKVAVGMADTWACWTPFWPAQHTKWDPGNLLGMDSFPHTKQSLIYLFMKTFIILLLIAYNVTGFVTDARHNGEQKQTQFLPTQIV